MNILGWINIFSIACKIVVVHLEKINWPAIQYVGQLAWHSNSAFSCSWAKATVLKPGFMLKYGIIQVRLFFQWNSMPNTHLSYPHVCLPNQIEHVRNICTSQLMCMPASIRSAARGGQIGIQRALCQAGI